MSNNTAQKVAPLHVNLTSYDNVESLDNFDESRFSDYCCDKLKACDKHVGFIQKHLALDENWHGKVCEMGSGNSRLLYRLEKENILTSGVGIEISNSRHQFAKEFGKHVKSTRVNNINDNIFAVSPPEECDLILGIDIALQLMTPVTQNAERELLSWIRQAIKPNGYLILEMWDLELILKQIELASGNLQYWKEFSKSDPFEFILMQVEQNEEHDLVWNKTFIKRHSLERSYFTNVIRPYSRQRIESLLKMYGFGDIQFFDHWQEPGDVNDEGEYIVLARKTD